MLQLSSRCERKSRKAQPKWYRVRMNRTRTNSRTVIQHLWTLFRKPARKMIWPLTSRLNTMPLQQNWKWCCRSSRKSCKNGNETMNSPKVCFSLCVTISPARTDVSTPPISFAFAVSYRKLYNRYSTAFKQKDRSDWMVRHVSRDAPCGTSLRRCRIYLFVQEGHKRRKVHQLFTQMQIRD